MTGAVQPQTAPSSMGMFRAMVGVGLVCGLLIVSAHIGTRPAIERNRAEALRRAIFQVVAGAEAFETYVYLEDGRFERETPETALPGPRVYAAYDAGGGLAGVAIEAAGMGYQDVIRVLYGYAFESQAIVGMQVLESRETPGLGDRIETDPAFRANFEQLDVSLAPDGEGLANPVEAVKQGEKEHPWQIDGITGATISAVAIADILASSTAEWIPRLQRRRTDFEGGP